ncbi:adhesin [Asanoa sp. WMMD1127]|uniref:adhesin n=1 Tax=Asanoa sp. WMMD1127 TaxID=3016107 RepID=UPI002416EFC5|nr:adhesin [Asanoa sp. WMMD1127]MDG4824956.1 adhesin [Asanoa sp. WMMD1127]
MTDKALAAICVLLTQDGVPDGAGLRVSTHPEHGLRLGLVGEPAAGDSVFDRSGARIFLDAEAVEILRHTALDAEPDGAGGVRFAVMPAVS